MMINKIQIHWSCSEPDMIRVLIHMDGETEALWVKRTEAGWELQDYFGFDGVLEPFFRGSDGARFAQACGDLVAAACVSDSVTSLLIQPKLESPVCRDLVRFAQAWCK